MTTSERRRGAGVALQVNFSIAAVKAGDVVLNWFKRALGLGADRRTAESDGSDQDAEPEPDPEEVLATVERFLTEFGLDAEDVRWTYEYVYDWDLETGRSTREYIVEHDEQLANGLDVLDGSLGYSILHELLRWSPKGVFLDHGYAEATAESHMNRALERHDYELSMTRPGGEPLDYVEEDGATIELRLHDGDRTVAETTFQYPDDGLGRGDFAALVRAVNDELLAETDVRFHQLGAIGDAWPFVLLDDETHRELREQHGLPVEAFGRPILLAEVTGDVMY